jgi:predicted DNA-binding transcriptional regulator AlpA
VNQIAIVSWDDLPKWGIRLSKSQIYRLIRKGRFPQPFKITPNRDAWTAEQLNTYVAERIAETEAA